MINERSWKEFSETGILWLINQTLHLFGWALVMEMEDDEITRVYPARVKFRGFDENTNTEGYKRVSRYLKGNIEELDKEANE